MNRVELEICAFEDVTPPTEVFGIMETRCFNEQQWVPTQDGRPIYLCELAVIQPNQGGIFRFIERRGVRDCTLDELATYRLAAPGNSTTATITGLVSASNPDLSASAVVSGTIELSGGNCRDGTCPLTIHLLELASDEVNAVVGGSDETATNLTVVNTNEANGTCIGAATLNSCLALLDNGGMRLVISADTEGGDRKAIDAINVDTGGAIINYGTREVFITGTFVNGDTTVEFGVAGEVDNLAPRIALPPPATLDCGFGVMLHADIEDVDGDPAGARVAWFVDGERVDGVDQTTTVVDLAVGVRSRHRCRRQLCRRPDERDHQPGHDATPSCRRGGRCMPLAARSPACTLRAIRARVNGDRRMRSESTNPAPVGQQLSAGQWTRRRRHHW